MKYITLLVEYDGTAYQGWQSQKSRLTIQDTLSEKIRSITGEEVRLTGSSRTDAGVHAMGQVAAFGTNSDLSPDVLKRALNAKLPPDIRILSSEETDAGFHPRYDAVKKRYVYLIGQGRVRSAFFGRYLWQAKAGLDLEAMKEAAAMLTGEHDFSSFRGAGCSARTTVRTVYSISVLQLNVMEFMTIPLKGDYVKVVIEANAFLRHMARNIVGTLVEIGKGRLKVSDMSCILNSLDRTKAGPTAPAAGLFLEKVFY
jgi:tRNA pseudouridine38-40 synthase